MSIFDSPSSERQSVHEAHVHSEDWKETFKGVMDVLTDEYKRMARATLSQAIDAELEFKPVSLKNLQSQNVRNFEYLIDFDPAIRRLAILIINKDNNLHKELEIQESDKRDKMIEKILGNNALVDELDQFDGATINEIRKQEEERAEDELKALRELMDETKENKQTA